MVLIILLLPSISHAARLVGGGGGLGEGDVILNQDTLQSGATFYVSSGTVQNELYIRTESGLFSVIPQANNFADGEFKYTSYGNDALSFVVDNAAGNSATLSINPADASALWNFEASEAPNQQMTVGPSYHVFTATAGSNFTIGNYSHGIVTVVNDESNLPGKVYLNLEDNDSGPFIQMLRGTAGSTHMIQIDRDYAGIDPKIQMINESNGTYGSSIESYKVNAAGTREPAARIVGERWSGSANFGHLAFELGSFGSWTRKATLDVNGLFTATTVTGAPTLRAADSGGGDTVALHSNTGSTPPGLGTMRHGIWGEDHLNATYRVSGNDVLITDWRLRWGWGYTPATTPSTPGKFSFKADDASEPMMVFVATTSQSSPMTQWRNISDVVLSTVTARGTFTGPIQKKTQTLAWFAANAPIEGAVGETYYCSDCATSTTCVSTGTATAQWADVSGKTTACQ